MSSPSETDTFLARVMHRRWRVLLALLGTLGVLLLVASLLGGYLGGWGWVGVTAQTVPTPPGETFQPPKTLWDWLQLLALPAALAVAGYWLATQARRRDVADTERRHRDDAALAKDKQREDVLAAYLERMSALLLEHHLAPAAAGAAAQPPEPDPVAAGVAHALTLATLRRLDANRNRLVLAFLRESGLLQPPHPIIRLDQADLSKADLSKADLTGALLGGAVLRGADLSGAVLHAADLSGAVLVEAHLEQAVLGGANLSGADLSFAHLSGAILSKADLSRAHLSGADMRFANLSGADLGGANLSGADLSFAHLSEEADLSGANLSGAVLSDALLRGADLSKADLTGADLTGAKYNKRKQDSLYTTQWPDGFDPDKAGAMQVER